MALRKSKEENFQINGNLNEIVEKCRRALINGKFTHIDFSSTINEFTADYHKATVWGKIKVTLTVSENNNYNGSADESFKVQGDGTIVRIGGNNNGSNKVNISVVSTGHVDNIYALFNSPNDKILSQFKNNL